MKFSDYFDVNVKERVEDIDDFYSSGVLDTLESKPIYPPQTNLKNTTQMNYADYFFNENYSYLKYITTDSNCYPAYNVDTNLLDIVEYIEEQNDVIIRHSFSPTDFGLSSFETRRNWMSIVDNKLYLGFFNRQKLVSISLTDFTVTEIQGLPALGTDNQFLAYYEDKILLQKSAIKEGRIVTYEFCIFDLITNSVVLNFTKTSQNDRYYYYGKYAYVMGNKDTKFLQVSVRHDHQNPDVPIKFWVNMETGVLEDPSDISPKSIGYTITHPRGINESGVFVYNNANLANKSLSAFTDSSYIMLNRDYVINLNSRIVICLDLQITKILTRRA